MAGRRSRLAGLERALRAFQPGSHNLGHYLAEYSDEFAALLGIQTDELQMLSSQSDEKVAPRIKESLRARESARIVLAQAARQEIAAIAAQQLTSTALWRANAALLDVSVLLGDLLADPNAKYIRFISRAFEVHLPRQKLVEAAHVLPRQFTDLVSWVDPAGLHFRWRDGRGGLNLFPQLVPARESTQVLCVSIAAPAVERVQPIPGFRERRNRVARPAIANGPTPGRPNTSWLAEALTEIAFPA